MSDVREKISSFVNSLQADDYISAKKELHGIVSDKISTDIADKAYSFIQTDFKGGFNPIENEPATSAE